jgi:protein-tyrosine-phosphatase
LTVSTSAITRVLFFCLGKRCRSPAAKAAFAAQRERQVRAADGFSRVFNLVEATSEGLLQALSQQRVKGDEVSTG